MPRPIHFELQVDDPERAIAFYSQVFEWTFREQPGDEPYWLIATGPASEPGINGGMLRRFGDPPIEGAPVNGCACLIDVPSVDEYVRRVENAGGIVVMPKMMTSMGLLSYAKDTEENVFGLLQRDHASK